MMSPVPDHCEGDASSVHNSGAGSCGSALGVLYVCATPIGNLEDVSFRLVRVLHEVAVIAAEDTRLTRRLLDRHNIDTPLTSYHQYSQPAKTDSLVTRLRAGESIALVCNAGTPGISDPGVPLVTAAAAAGMAVIPIPGPSAVAAAISASGFSAQQFHFSGFLPKKAKARREALIDHACSSATTVVYESPERITKTICDLREIWGNRRAVLFRELTKIHEEAIRGSLLEISRMLKSRPLRGEMTLVIEGKPIADPPEPVAEADLLRWLKDNGTSSATTRQLATTLAEQTGCSRNAAYQAVVEWRRGG